MHWLSTFIDNFRPCRGTSSFISFGSALLLALLLVTTQVACDNEATGETLESFDIGDDYSDVDNVEWHHVKIIDGIMHEDHPVIMYKEDFVSEDYDPLKHNINNNNNSSAETLKSAEVTATAAPNTAIKKQRKHHHRRLNRRLHRRPQTEQYNVIKPEKIYFDVLPQAPVVVADDSSANDSKFDASKIRVEVISLADDVDVNNANVDGATTAVEAIDVENSTAVQKGNSSEIVSKDSLQKRPKKYRHRMRRNAPVDPNAEHFIKKRNPYYIIDRRANALDVIFQRLTQYPHQQQPTPKYQVPGNYWNGLNSIPFNDRAGAADDRVVWAFKAYETTKRPNTIRPAPPLFHDSNPENADFSFMNQQRPAQTTRSPIQTAPPSRGGSTVQQNATTRGARTDVSKCVWAIVQCCSNRDAKIRYQCFERNGCHGAFWDLNPCADNVRDSVVDYFDEMSRDSP